MAKNKNKSRKTEKHMYSEDSARMEDDKYWKIYKLDLNKTAGANLCESQGNGQAHAISSFSITSVKVHNHTHPLGHAMKNGRNYQKNVRGIRTVLVYVIGIPQMIGIVGFALAAHTWMCIKNYLDKCLAPLFAFLPIPCHERLLSSINEIAGPTNVPTETIKIDRFRYTARASTLVEQLLLTQIK